MNEEDVFKTCEMTQLILSLKFVKSPFMKKKLNGLTEIISILESFSHRTTRLRAMYYEDSRHQTFKFIDSEFMIQWIKDEKLIEYLLTDSAHSELIKKAT